MKTFLISSGKERRTITLPGKGVLSFHLTCTEGTDRNDGESLFTHLGGLDSDREVHLRWRPIRVEAGSKVTIEVEEEGGAADPVEFEYPVSSEQKRESLEIFVRKQAEILGWKIDESPEETSDSSDARDGL